MTWRQCQFGDYRRLRSGRKSVETALEIPFIWDAIQDGFGCTTRLREVVRDTAFFFPTVEERRVEDRHRTFLPLLQWHCHRRSPFLRRRQGLAGWSYYRSFLVLHPKDR